MRQSLLRQPAVSIESGTPRSTLYLRIAQGLWTEPVKIGERAVAWPVHEIESLNAARIAGKSNEEIRALVIELHAARKTLAGGV